MVTDYGHSSTLSTVFPLLTPMYYQTCGYPPQEWNEPMNHSTRVLSRSPEMPDFADLKDKLEANHPDFRLRIEEGTEEEWESLLLLSTDEVEVALLERKPVFDGSMGQDELADLEEDLYDVKPESAVEWLKEFFAETAVVYSFEHYQGSETVDGLAALHALRALLMDRGESILQADGEGFTNEEGYHIVWQFSENAAGPWNMAVLQEGEWQNFAMDLGDPEHREAFQMGEAPADVRTVKSATKSE